MQREHDIKHWSRTWKVRPASNPKWNDLLERFGLQAWTAGGADKFT
jgi:predicted GIY-YIG superfamily endonuclease